MIEFIRNFISKSLIDNEIEEKRAVSFRGSDLPLCPRKLMFGSFHEKMTFEKKIPFTERYNYHVGRAIHSLVQETWAAQGLLWGDWQCTDHKHCGVKFSNTRLEGGKCIRCGSPCLYIEKLITEKESGFSGHCDAIVFSEDNDGYFIFELKSRNSNIIYNSLDPYLSDLFQVSVYATLLQRIHWLRIIGRVVLWIGKPKPKPFKVWYYPGIGEDIADSQFNLKIETDKQIREGAVLDIKGLCDDFDGVDGCPFAGVCRSPVRDKLIMTEYEEFLNCHK